TWYSARACTPAISGIRSAIPRKLPSIRRCSTGSRWSRSSRMATTRYGFMKSSSNDDLNRPRLSVVGPLYNEEESVGRLVQAVQEALGPSNDWELVLVDDGSRDGTVARARSAAVQDPRVRLVRLARNYGQTPAMQAGFASARGDVVVTMDGDLPDDPAGLPRRVARR